jgi:hypothetical protein
MISKAGCETSPNLADYDQARADFTWEAARAELDGLPGGRGLNIAHEAVDRHASYGIIAPLTHGDTPSWTRLTSTPAEGELAPASRLAKRDRTQLRRRRPSAIASPGKRAAQRDLWP